MSNEQMIREFEELFSSHPIPESPQLLPADRTLKRVRLISEEFAEYIEAAQKQNLIECAKELADLLVVVYGTAVLMGLPMGEIFEEVHRSNMSKIGADGTPAYDVGGKVVKGPNYSPPDIRGILEKHWRQIQRWG